MERPILLTREEAAEFLGVVPDTLRVWAYREDYHLPFRKVGRKVEYLLSDLEQFIQDRTKFKR